MSTQAKVAEAQAATQAKRTAAAVQINKPLADRVVSAGTITDTYRFFRGVLIGETDSGKTFTSGTLTPGRDTCVIFSNPSSQCIVHHPDVRIFPTRTFEETVKALKHPESIFGDDIKTLVWDDATFTINQALDEADILKLNDRRQAYGDVKFTLSPVLTSVTSKPFNFIAIGQASRSTDEVTGRESINLDVPPSMRSMITSIVDYALFVNKPKRLGQAPSLQLIPQRAMLSKVKLPHSQLASPPVKEVEPADLAALWEKLSNTDNITNNKENK